MTESEVKMKGKSRMRKQGNKARKQTQKHKQPNQTNELNQAPFNIINNPLQNGMFMENGGDHPVASVASVAETSGTAISPTHPPFVQNTDINSFLFHYHPKRGKTKKVYLFIVNFHWPFYDQAEFIRDTYFREFSNYFHSSFDVILVGPSHNDTLLVYGNGLRKNGYYSYYSMPFVYHLLCEKQRCNYEGFLFMNDDSFIDPVFLNDYDLTRSYSEPHINYTRTMGWTWLHQPNFFHIPNWRAYDNAVRELMNSDFKEVCDLYDQANRKKGYSDAFYLYKDDVKIYNTVATKMYEHRVFLEMASATAIACIPNHDHFIDCNHWPMKHRRRCVHMHPLKYRKKNNKQIALSRMIRRKLNRVPRLIY